MCGTDIIPAQQMIAASNKDPESGRRFQHPGGELKDAASLELLTRPLLKEDTIPTIFHLRTLVTGNVCSQKRVYTENTGNLLSQPNPRKVNVIEGYAFGLGQIKFLFCAINLAESC